ncbi:MAG: hypothetical protein JW874_13305 [Spirochaetales bacterium]|nr:hypothetical protein [Spirochaetales bacterium]
MSTIPTTFNSTKVPYTVICGQKTNMPREMTFSLLLLNRGERPFKATVLTELEKLSLDEIISVEGPHKSHEVEGLSRQFPKVRFLTLHEDTSTGEKVNIGIQEAMGQYVLVLWDDMKVGSASISSRLLERIRENGELCVVPLIQNRKNETVPSIMAPAFFRRKLKVVSLLPVKDSLPSIFPFDYAGVYCKEHFLLVGGYDRSLKNPYWQKLDFGFRSFMWGYRIICNTALRVSFQGDVPSEDATPDMSYKIFFLKNLSIKFSGDSGVLPAGRFFSYFFRSGTGFFNALKEFRAVRKWVQVNTYRFIQDARRITELWETPDM